MKLYYAHPQSWYGTPEEQEDLAFLKEKFPDDEIVNPADLGLSDMADFLHWVQDCDALVYRPFMDRGIGAGVAREILEAKLFDKPVYTLYYRWSGADVHRVMNPRKATKGERFVGLEKMATRTLGPILTIKETRARLKQKEL